MIVAIALFNQEISPRFDCCRKLAFVGLEDKMCDAEYIEMHQPGSNNLHNELLTKDTSVLLCGGVRRCDLFRLESVGVHVVYGLAGNAEKRFEEFCEANCNNQCFLNLISEKRKSQLGKEDEEIMPGFNGRGPEGKGPRTGRQRGRCRIPASATQADAENELTDTEETDVDELETLNGRGRGMGRGPGRGQGRGLGNGRGRGQGMGRGRNSQ